MAGGPSGDHSRRRAARALDVAPLRVDPEPQRHSDRLRSGAEQRHRAVDAAAHRDRDPLRVASRPEDRPDRGGERVHGELVAADGGRLEQGQPLERPVEPLGVRRDDPVAVDGEPDEAPLAVPGRISDDFDHRATVAEERDGPASRRPTREKCPTLPVMPRAMRTWTSQVGAEPNRLLRAGADPSSLSRVVGSRLYARPRTGSSTSHCKAPWPVQAGRAKRQRIVARLPHAELLRKGVGQPELDASRSRVARDDLGQNLLAPVTEVDLGAARKHRVREPHRRALDDVTARRRPSVEARCAPVPPSPRTSRRRAVRRPPGDSPHCPIRPGGRPG